MSETMTPHLKWSQVKQPIHLEIMVPAGESLGGVYILLVFILFTVSYWLFRKGEWLMELLSTGHFGFKSLKRIFWIFFHFSYLQYNLSICIHIYQNDLIMWLWWCKKWANKKYQTFYKDHTYNNLWIHS